MKKIALLLALMIAALVPAEGEVLIYKGSVRVTTSPGTSFPPVLETFYIFDVAARQSASMLLFQGNGKKTQISTAPGDVHMTTAALRAGGSARLITRSFAADTPPNYSDSLTYFRGTKTTLLVATGAFDTTRSEPRLLKGIQFIAGEAGGEGSFIEGRFTLRYQQSRTISANNASMTLQQVLDDLVAEMTAKGYTAPGP